MQLLPINQEKAQALETKVSQGFWGGVEQFIELYNRKIINASANEVKDTADLIAATYKNVELKNKKFIIKDIDEITIDNFKFLTPYLELVVILKRIAQNVSQENYPAGICFAFLNDKPGVIMLYEPDGEDVVEYDGAERMSSKFNEQLAENPFINYLIQDETINNIDYGILKIEDVLDVDTSFVGEIGKLLEKYISKE